MEIERSALAAQVEAQSINPEDIDRMNADKDMLVKTLDSLNQSKEELARLFWEREMAMQKKLDSVSDALLICRLRSWSMNTILLRRSLASTS